MQKHFFPLDGRDLKVALIHQLLLVYFKGVRIECGKRDSCIMEHCSWLWQPREPLVVILCLVKTNFPRSPLANQLCCPLVHGNLNRKKVNYRVRRLANKNMLDKGK
jgi:hypothetical protein